MSRPRKPQARTGAEPRTPRSRGARFPWTWLLAVLAITAVCLAPTLSNGFTNWDDPQYVLNDPLLRGPDWIGILTHPVGSNYHPLTIASLALDYLVSGTQPHAYHVTSVLLHLLDTALVCVLAWRLSRGRPWVAAFTALFFGIHPMHVESVAWISERKDLLYAAGFFASMIAYLEFQRSGKALAYALALLAFMLALLSKPAAIVLPLVLLILDDWQGRRLTVRTVLEKLPFVALAIAFGVVAYRIQSRSAIDVAGTYRFGIRLLFAGYCCFEYLLRLFWPWPLSVVHPLPDATPLPLVYVVGTIATLVLAVLAVVKRKNGAIRFGALFYLVMIGPVLQLVTFGNSIIAERYTYVAYVGPVFALAMLASDRARSDGVRRGLAVGAAVVAAVFAVATWERTHVWHDSEALWTDALQTYPHSALAHTNRGDYYSARNELEPALQDLDAALAVSPRNRFALRLRAMAYVRLQRPRDGVTDANRCVAEYPDDARCYFVRGVARMATGDTAGAVSDYSRSIGLDSTSAESFAGRAIAFFGRARYAEAAKDFDRAVILEPARGEYWIDRGRCYYLLGDSTRARASVARSLELGAHVPAEMMQVLGVR